MSESGERQAKPTQFQGEDATGISRVTGEESKPLDALSSSLQVYVQPDLERRTSSSHKRHLPVGLSFLSRTSFGRYPDTAESGQTYDMEMSFPSKRTPVVAPIGEYSE